METKNRNLSDLEELRNHPPKEWVKLRESEDDSFSEGEYAKAFCKYIDKFYWRSREDKNDELHVIFRESDGPNARYRYFDVPRSVYEEMWDRAYFPGDYDLDIGKWFFKNIRNEFEYERYKD